MYRTSKLEINRSRWIKRTVERYSGWIGFASMGHHITVLDYCAGTGFLSQVRSFPFFFFFFFFFFLGACNLWYWLFGDCYDADLFLSSE